MIRLRTGLPAALGALALALAAGQASAETRVTYKSAKAGTSYYQMGVEVAEAVQRAAGGTLSVTIEESQGSVQNVMEAAIRPGAFIFTTPPDLVAAAQAGTGAFKDKGNPKFAEIRALFPLPALSMHFIARGDLKAKRLSDLEGRSLLLGKGSFGATEGEKYLKLFGLEGKIKIANAELSNAVAALKNGQIDAFVTAGSWPAPNVIEAAASMDVSILSLTDDEVSKTGRARLEIPPGVYKGQSEPIVTTALQVIAFSSTQMDDATAYAVVKAFWEEKAAMAQTSAWWQGVDKAHIGSVRAKFHPGALRYYLEAGYPVTEDQR